MGSSDIDREAYEHGSVWGTMVGILREIEARRPLGHEERSCARSGAGNPGRCGGVNTVVAAAAGDTGKLGVAERLGIESDMVVQELGWDEDVDDDVRAAIEEVIGGDLLDEDSDEVVDVVLLWWRDQDGDLVDTLVDARTPLADNGVIWVLTPKTGRDGHVEPSDLAEAAPTVGLAQTSNLSVSEDWTATRLATPKAAKAKR